MSYNYMILADKLRDEYTDAFKRAELYSLAVRIDEETREEMMMNLLDLLLSAQEEGKPAEKIVGNNLEVFCKNYFGHDLKKRQFRDFLDSLYRMAWVALIIELIDIFSSEGPSGSNPFLQTSDITGYFIGFGGALLFSVLFAYICKPLLFQKKRIPFVAFCLVSIAGTLFFAAGLLFLVGDNIVTAPYWVVLLLIVLYIVLYYTLRAVSRYKDHGNIHKRRDPGEEPFLKAVGASALEDLPEELEKVYQKTVQKQERKGKPLMSGEEYLNKLRSDVNRDKILNPVVDAILVLFVLGWVIAPFFTEEESLLYPAIQAFFTLLFEIPVFLFCRFMYRANKQKENIVDYCEQHSITLTEYVAERSQETSSPEDEGELSPPAKNVSEQSQETSEEDADA